MSAPDLSPLVAAVTRYGLSVTTSFPGGQPGQEVASLRFADFEDAVEFLRHTGLESAYSFGDQLGCAILHPATDITGTPEGKVMWLPELTELITRVWEKE